MNKIYYFSDLLVEDLVGGGELNDYELCDMLLKKGYKLSRLRTREIKQEHLDKNCTYIVSNFVGLKPEYKEYLIKNCKYIIYEHDHKYLASRNPAIYENYQAPENKTTEIDGFMFSPSIVEPKSKSNQQHECERQCHDLLQARKGRV